MLQVKDNPKIDPKVVVVAGSTRSPVINGNSSGDCGSEVAMADRSNQ